MSHAPEDLVPPPFSVEQREDANGRRTLAVTGELDISTFESLLAAVDAAGGARRLVIDLRAVTFLDSSGLRGLVLAARRCADRDTELRIVRGPGTPRELFRLTRLDEDLPLLDEED
jgi:anti-sigma B factor antagonist